MRIRSKKIKCTCTPVIHLLITSRWFHCLQITVFMVLHDLIPVHLYGFTTRHPRQASSRAGSPRLTMLVSRILHILFFQLRVARPFSPSIIIPSSTSPPPPSPSPKPQAWLRCVLSEKPQISILIICVHVCLSH